MYVVETHHELEILLPQPPECWNYRHAKSFVFKEILLTITFLKYIIFIFGFSFVIYVSFLDNEVYAWGNNSMGQCGQGNSTGPITKPKKVSGLDGIAIQQISAGTSHSLAWTALPRDR
jgi:alpha-tubulin suppressor-like RCC1 family protein